MNLTGQHRPGGVAARGIANARGVVTDDQDGTVAPVLELTRHQERDGVAQRDIGGGGVHPKLDAQRHARPSAPLELGAQIRLRDHLIGAAGERRELVVGRHGLGHGERGDCAARRAERVNQRCWNPLASPVRQPARRINFSIGAGNRV